MHGLLVNTKHMTGFTHKYLPLVSDYLQVLSAQQDSLMSIYHSSVITHKYKSAQQELVISIFYSSVIARKQFISCVVRCPTCDLSLKFLEAQSITHVFCKLG